jgi:hypothetical protein
MIHQGEWWTYEQYARNLRAVVDYLLEHHPNSLSPYHEKFHRDFYRCLVILTSKIYKYPENRELIKELVAGYPLLPDFIAPAPEVNHV